MGFAKFPVGRSRPVKRNQFNVRDNVCEHSLFDKNSDRQRKYTKNA